MTTLRHLLDSVATGQIHEDSALASLLAAGLAQALPAMDPKQVAKRRLKQGAASLAKKVAPYALGAGALGAGGYELLHSFGPDPSNVGHISQQAIATEEMKQLIHLGKKLGARAHRTIPQMAALHLRKQ